MKEVLINSTSQEVRAAIVEEGELVEFMVERAATRRLVGDIYLGRVNAILPGIQAAFVDIGYEKAGFLHASDLVPDTESMEGDVDVDDEDNGRHGRGHDDDDEGEGDRNGRRDNHRRGGRGRDDRGGRGGGGRRDNRERPPVQPIEKMLTKGQEVLVQVTKEAIGTKGPRLTTQVSLPGRHVVYMPNSDYLGISRRIESQTGAHAPAPVDLEEEAAQLRRHRAHRVRRRRGQADRRRHQLSAQAVARNQTPRREGASARTGARRSRHGGRHGARPHRGRHRQDLDGQRARVPPARAPSAPSESRARVADPACSATSRPSSRSTTSRTRSKRRSSARCGSRRAATSCSTRPKRWWWSTSTRGASSASATKRRRFSRPTCWPRAKCRGNCDCATSAASSSSTSSTWRARPTRRRC